MSETTGDPIRSRIYDALFSRRGFLGTSALAAATLSFTNNVHAQEHSSVIEGEGNQSANDPGPQNKTLPGAAAGWVYAAADRSQSG